MKRAKFCPGQSGSERPFGCVDVVRITVPGEWLSGPNNLRRNDWGVMTFNVVMKAFVPIGSFCSPFPFPPSRINVWVLSYPSLPDGSDGERVYYENRDR